MLALQVGGRSAVSPSITQVIEVRNTDEERFARLLEILADHGEEGKVLVFVNSQEKCSALFQQLLNYGYPNQMLHGDMQQVRVLQAAAVACTGVATLLAWAFVGCA